VSALARRALILDFGAVCAKLPFEMLDLIETGFGLAPGSLDWRGPLDPQRDALWRDVAAGRITERDYWPIRAREVSATRGEIWDAGDLFRRIVGFAGESWLRPGMMAIIRETRARGVPVAILSNELELFIGRAAMETLSVFKQVDAVVDATVTGIFKPDPRAYALALEAVGAKAEDALFVDDQPRNVEGARAAGLAAVHFDIADVEASLAAVRAALGL
jgi:putative hydrolase of the HAD superfamily